MLFKGLLIFVADAVLLLLDVPFLSIVFSVLFALKLLLLGVLAFGNSISFCETKPDSFVFLTTKTISESGGGTTLTECHESNPQSIVAKLMSIPMRLFFKGVIKKAALQDLNDVKAAVEQE